MKSGCILPHISFQGKFDTAHQVRIAFGNGLRRDVWSEFVDRFRVPVIGEFYAATEGNSGFMNVFNKVGCIGRTSPFLVINSYW